MRRARKGNMIPVLLVGVVCALSIPVRSVESQAQGLAEVIWKGTFLARTDKGDANTYLLHVRDKNLRFRVAEIRLPATYPGSANGMEILDELATPRIWFIGKENDIQLLRETDLSGKSFRIQGTLYVADGILSIASLTEISKSDG